MSNSLGIQCDEDFVNHRLCVIGNAVTKLRAPRLSTAPTVFSCSEDGKVLQSLLSANEQEVRESASDVLIDEPSAITSMFIEERIGRRQMVSLAVLIQKLRVERSC